MVQVRFSDDRFTVEVDATVMRFESTFPKAAPVITEMTRAAAAVGDATYGSGPKSLAQYALGATEHLGETTAWSNSFSNYRFNWTDNPVSRIGWAAVNMVYGIVHLATGPETYDVRGVTEWGMSVAMLFAVPHAGKTVKALGHGMVKGVVTPALDTLQSWRPVPNTPTNLWMQHSERGAVMVQMAAPALDLTRTRALINQAALAKGVNDPAMQHLFTLISIDPDPLVAVLDDLIVASRESRPLALVLNELQQAKPSAFTSAHIAAILEAARDQFMLFETIRGLLATHAGEFQTDHALPLHALARWHGRGFDLLYQQLQQKRPDLFHP